MNRTNEKARNLCAPALLRLSLACCVGLFGIPKAMGVDGNVASLKAAYVYNFSKFVTWPQSAYTNASSPLTIGVIGDDAVETELEAIVKDKVVGGRHFQIRTIDWKDAPQCQIVFVSATESESGPKIGKLRGKPVLVITESPGMTRFGSIINLRIEAGRLRFEIDADMAKTDGITISSKLLSLAK